MKSKAKKVEGKTYFYKLNYKATKKHLDSQGISYKEISPDRFNDFNLIIIENKWGVHNYQVVNYFCSCGARITPDLHYCRSIIQDLSFKICKYMGPEEPDS